MGRTVGEIRKLILGAIDGLPPLNEVAHQLIKLMGSDLTSATDLDCMIRNDQALTARVLKLANSSVYGKSRRISSLTEAVVLLGHATLRDMVLGITVADIMTESELPGFAAAAWAHSIDCAAGGRALAQLTGTVDPEMAFVTGLMHDIGLLVMAHAVPQELEAVLQAAPRDPLAAERAHMGLNHPQVGQRLLDQWNLPQAICEAVRFHHAPSRTYIKSNPLVNLLAMADLMTSIDGATLYPPTTNTDPFALLRTCRIREGHFPNLFRQMGACRTSAHNLAESIAAFGNIAGAPPPDDAMRVFSVCASDEMRRAWHEAVLTHLGHRVVPWPDGAPAPEADVEWLIADLHGMAPGERDDLCRTLTDRGLELALVGDSPDAHWPRAPQLPALLTRSSLSELPVRAPDPANHPV